MSVIDDYTAACEMKLPLEDRAQYTLALVDEAFVVLHGKDPNGWLPGVQAKYEACIAEVHDAYAAGLLDGAL